MHWWSRTNLMNAGGVRLPVRREAFEVLEDGVDAGLAEQHDRVLGVLVEVGIEDPLVHEARVVIEEHPAQVVQLERREDIRVALERLGQPQRRSSRIASALPGLTFAMMVKP